MQLHDVREAYANLNGEEAAAEVTERCYAATTQYANLLGTEDAEDVLVALDVFRLVESGEFEEFRTN